MRKARSMPLGATRFRVIQVLGDLKLYEDRIASRQREVRILEDEWLRRRREEEEAARALEARRAEVSARLRKAAEATIEAQRRDAEVAARSLGARKAAIAIRDRQAAEAMTDEQRATCRWEERVAAWLALTNDECPPICE